MVPIPTAWWTWLWRRLEGETAVKATRLAVFGILIGNWLGAYWAMSTRHHIEHRLDEFSEVRQARDQQLSIVNATLSRIADALVTMHDLDEQQAKEIALLADRVAHAEGRLDERHLR